MEICLKITMEHPCTAGESENWCEHFGKPIGSVC